MLAPQNYLTDPYFRETLNNLLDSVRAFQKTARAEYGPDGWAEALFQLEVV